MYRDRLRIDLGHGHCTATLLRIDLLIGPSLTTASLVG
jgi:hypothetical protein